MLDTIVEPALQTSVEKAAQRYGTLAGTSKASADIRLILSAALDGRVDVLFIDSSDQLWGSIRADGRTVEVHSSRLAGDDELLDLAATRTLLHGGTVYAVEHEQLANLSSVAALFRY